MPVKQVIEILGQKFTVELPHSECTGRSIINGKEVTIDYRAGTSGSPGSLIVDGRCFSVECIPDEEYFIVRTNETDIKAAVSDERREKLKRLTQGSKGKTSSSGIIKAPMPGLIVKLEVEVGKHVEKGAGLLIIEAMKMENEIKSSVEGNVTEIKIQSGQTVEKGQHLLTIS